MTDTKQAGIPLGGVPVGQHLAIRIRNLSASVVKELAEQLSAYASLPEEELRGDITQVVKLCIRMFTHQLLTGERPTNRQLQEVRDSAGRRAEEGVPVEALVGAYHLGAEVCLEQVLAAIGPDDATAVLAVQRELLRFLGEVVAAAFSGYLDARLATMGEEHDARRVMLSALLTGSSPQEAAQRAAIWLPSCYAVISLEVGPNPDELKSDVDPVVAARRKLRRLRTEAEAQIPGAVLHLLSPEGGLILVPVDVGPDPSAASVLPPPARARLLTLTDHLVRAGGAELIGGVVPARPDEVPAAARLAAEIRQVARASGRPAGIYQLADLAFDYQMTRPGPARDQLASLLQPLASRPDLLETVRVFLACGLDRRRTASRLHVHPNTVDYRLRKAATLTGLDPTRGSDLPTIHAAFAAHAASSGGFG